jgi:hypothetical protein
VAPRSEPAPEPIAPRQAGQVDYRFMRQMTIAGFRAGRIARHEVCDAHPELLRAARSVGKPTSEPCPVCGACTVVEVPYVFGHRLPAHGRCVASRAELGRLAAQGRDLSCYVVEVCPECRWHHLTLSFPLGPSGRVSC